MQRIVLFRHAIAQSRQHAIIEGVTDDARGLTGEGMGKALDAVAGLKNIVAEVDAIFTSPLRRAVQTAEILAETYACRMQVLRELSPGVPPSKVLQALREQGAPSSSVCVGHEPELSQLAGWLLTGSRRSFISLKKSGACALEFNTALVEGEATLAWCLTPRILRHLAD